MNTGITRGGAPRIAVIGGGISGLTAAYRLRRTLGPDAVLEVFESRERLGGILRTVDVGGQSVDVGAEAFIVRRPEALDLVTELGLADRVVAPTARRPAIWAGDRVHPLPSPALMGIPAGPESVAGLVDSDDLRLIAAEPDRPWEWVPGSDPTVGELVGDRFGPSTVARSVDPMLGGVYSSLAGDIGIREALPALAARLDAGSRGLTAAIGESISAATGSGPVFGTLVGGYALLIDALLRAGDAHVHLARPVDELHAADHGWTVVSAGDDHSYDGVVLATPPDQAARLLADAAPDVAEPLGAVPGASSVVVSIALASGTAVPDHSGVLVGTGESLRAKAFTFSSQKWAHLGGDDRPVSVRASFGRYGAPVPAPDAEPGVDARLVSEALDDLDAVCAAVGLDAPSARVIEARVQRWDRGLPVYAPGHLARMAKVLTARPSRLALAGSVYRGVGVPACIGQAGAAAAELVGDLSDGPSRDGGTMEE